MNKVFFFSSEMTNTGPYQHGLACWITPQTVRDKTIDTLCIQLLLGTQGLLHAATIFKQS